jgi:hypothetical protein
MVMVSALALSAIWAEPMAARPSSSPGSQIFSDTPKRKDISPDGVSAAKFYSGQWWRKQKAAPADFHDTVDGLAIPLGGEISTASNKSTPGKLPSSIHAAALALNSMYDYRRTTRIIGLRSG